MKASFAALAFSVSVALAQGGGGPTDLGCYVSSRCFRSQACTDPPVRAGTLHQRHGSHCRFSARLPARRCQLLLLQGEIRPRRFVKLEVARPACSPRSNFPLSVRDCANEACGSSQAAQRIIQYAAGLCSSKLVPELCIRSMCSADDFADGRLAGGGANGGSSMSGSMTGSGMSGSMTATGTGAMAGGSMMMPSPTPTMMMGNGSMGGNGIVALPRLFRLGQPFHMHDCTCVPIPDLIPS